MMHIDIEGKTPVNTPGNDFYPSWTPWSEEEWQTWLDKSQEYLDEIAELTKAGKIAERNAFIDSKSAHWGKLKPWLKALSYGKCWFSEVRELYSHYDVEHFRPKKERRELDGIVHDGYWWLAFEYTNFRLCGNVGNRKKGSWFPLKEGSLLSTFEEPCEESESHYLLDPINPCDPELLAFDEEGKAIPSPGCDSDWQKKRVEETIKFLKLSEHEPLAEARRALRAKMDLEIDQYQQALAKSAKGTNPAALEKAKEHLRTIKELTRPTAELSSVARWCLYFRNDPKLLRLVA